MLLRDYTITVFDCTFSRTDRNCTQECTINGLTIPKDMTVGIGIAALHYDADVWPEPHKYDPERSAVLPDIVFCH